MGNVEAARQRRLAQIKAQLDIEDDDELYEILEGDIETLAKEHETWMKDMEEEVKRDRAGRGLGMDGKPLKKKRKRRKDKKDQWDDMVDGDDEEDENFIDLDSEMPER